MGILGTHNTDKIKIEQKKYIDAYKKHIENGMLGKKLSECDCPMCMNLQSNADNIFEEQNKKAVTLSNQGDKQQSNAQSSREKLIEELERKLSNPTTPEEIADFILKDRERICEPLKVTKEVLSQSINSHNKQCVLLLNAMDETLQRAGIDV